MKLIENFIEKFHTLSLPSPEKCLIIEEGDELYIKEWAVFSKLIKTNLPINEVLIIYSQ